MIHEEYQYLQPTNVLQSKRSFINDGTYLFTYPKIEQFEQRIYDYELSETRTQIENSTMPEAAKELYQTKCLEQVAIHNLLQAVKEKNDKNFHDASVSIYGSPNEMLYWYTLEQINKRFKSLISKVDPKRRTLHKAYKIWSAYYETQNKPAIGVFHAPHYEGIYVPYDDEVDSAEKIAKIFKKYLERREITNWSVVIDSAGNRTAFSVEQATRTIHIPHGTDLRSRAKVLTKQYVKALLAHEIGVHVVRRERGEQSTLGLLATGLNKYLRGEEGLATFAEQLITGTEFYSGESGYFSIGAAMGLLGTPLDFARLFEVLHAYFILTYADKALEEDGFYELDELRMQSFDSAWNRTLRTFRGTSGKTPGAVYTRDIIYLEGNRNIWKLAGEEPKVKDEWLIGKYDPANTMHVEHLKALGLLS